MSHLDPDRLPLIALGEPATEDERAHLDVCDECALELAELEYTVVVGRSTVALGDLEAPPERVWGRISDELQLGKAGATAAAALTEPEPPAEPEPQSRTSTPAETEVTAAQTPTPTEPAPPKGEGAASIPAGTAGGAPAARRSGRGMRVFFALAASVALIIGAITTWTLVRQAQPVEIAAATLDAFPDHPGASGSAVVVEKADGARQVEVDLDDAASVDGFREVWLITADASALVSLGVLEGSTGVFTVPEGIDLREYVLVDISQEPEDGDPAHSGDSIVRGELGFV